MEQAAKKTKPHKVSRAPLSSGIVQEGHPALRMKARDVRPEEIGSPELARILAGMKEALAAEEDGVAIAAPQVGVPLRVFIVSARAYEIEEEERRRRRGKEGAEEEQEGGGKRGRKTGASKFADTVFINPVLRKLSKEKAWMDEGCLSVRFLYGKVRRSLKAEVRALDERGKPFVKGASGLMAQIFQHETDHLDGTLFIDKAKEVREMASDTGRNFAS